MTKSMMLLLGLMLSMAFILNQGVQGSETDGLIHKARHIAKTCAETEEEAEFDKKLASTIIGYIDTIHVCFASGSIRDVVLYSRPKCNGKRCEYIRLMQRFVATVTFGCDDEVLYVFCNNGTEFQEYEISK
jgi:hypothetical protein